MDYSFYKKTIDESFDRIKAEAEKDQTCLRKAVGCAILRFGADDLIECSQAINGPSHPDNICTNEVGNCGCSHAEPRAILKCLQSRYMNEPSYDESPVLLLTTFSSCTPCANLIIKAGFIDAVAYEIFAPHWARADTILKNAMPVWTRKEITPELLEKWMDDCSTE